MAFSAHGEGKVIGQLAAAEANFRRGLAIAANQAGKSLVKDAKSKMIASAVPSAPGAHPAVRSGQLLGTVNYEVAGHSQLIFGQGPAMNRSFDYALGTHQGTVKMAPRPGITLTVEAKQGEIADVLGRVTWRFIIGGGG